MTPQHTERLITGFHPDDVGDWVAELACGHNQHVRHRPPFQVRPWVTQPEGRAGRIGTPLPCRLCDRAELPDAVRFVRTTPTWTEDTMPAGLRRAHRVADGNWGRIVVRSGRLRFRAATQPPIDVVLAAGSSQPIPPAIEHDVEPVGPVKFAVEFFAIHRSPEPRPPAEGGDNGDAGGDPACWSGLLCPECGTVASEGYHQPWCPNARP